MSKNFLTVSLIVLLAASVFFMINTYAVSQENLREPLILKPVEGTMSVEKEKESKEITQGTLLGKTEEGIELECPLKHTDVKAEISGFISRVEVTQEFNNPFDSPIEAIYIFPLPHNGAVNSMEMVVGERKITGLIKTREEAREIYEQAKEEGKLTGLLEQERPNIFTQSVANIKPGDTIFVKITYVEIMDYDKGTYEFVFPMVVGPRYNPESVADASISPDYLKPDERTGHDISLEVKLNAGVPIQELRSKSHEVIVQTEGNNGAVITLNQADTIPNKDFILEYDVIGEKPESALISTGKKGTGYFTLMINPKRDYEESEITPKEMIFVLDCSGSMSGQPMDACKGAMKKCIEFMNPSDTFQIIRFSEYASGLSDKPLANTPENIKKGLEYVDSLSGQGGTNMIEGIKASLNYEPDRERMRIVFFMTDGYIGNETDILAEIEKNIGDARLFSLGVGSSVNRYLLEMMAETGRGEVQYVRQDEDPKVAVEQFYERIAKPYLTDIEIDWKNLKVSEVYPAKIPDLFSAEPLFIYGIYTDPGEDVITIKGKIGGKVVTFPVEVKFFEDNPENSALSSIWARQKIKELNNQQFRGDIPEIADQITALALEFKLMSKYTSFVAVEETYQVDEETGELQTIMVPVEMPEGTSYEGVFGENDGVCTESFSLACQPVYCTPPPPPPPAPTPIAVKIRLNLGDEIKTNSSSLELISDYDFNDALAKNNLNIQIVKDGNTIITLSEDDNSVKIQDKKNLILTFGENNSPFTESGEYTITVKVYDGQNNTLSEGMLTVFVN